MNGTVLETLESVKESAKIFKCWILNILRRLTLQMTSGRTRVEHHVNGFQDIIRIS